MDYQVEINEKFAKLEGIKYEKQSNKEHSRLLNFYDDCKWQEDFEDTYSLYEYIIEHDIE